MSSNAAVRKSLLCVNVFAGFAANLVERMLLLGRKRNLSVNPILAKPAESIFEQEVAEEFPFLAEVKTVTDADEPMACELGNMERLANLPEHLLTGLLVNAVFFELRKNVRRDRTRRLDLWTKIEIRHVQVASFEFATAPTRAQVVPADFHGFDVDPIAAQTSRR